MSTTKQITLGGRYTVNRMGFGAMRVTGVGVWGEPADAMAAKDLFRHVVASGVELIDTADSYGPDVSERLIGEALAPYADNVLIATKAGLVRPGPGEWDPCGRPDHIKAACEKSLGLLRLERIPLYQLHRIDPEVPVADTIGAMLELRTAGKIDLIGLSEVTTQELQQVRALTDVASVQNRFSVADREWSGVVDACTEAGIAFIPWYPLANGDLGAMGIALDTIAAAHRATRYTVALAWLLHRSPMILPIPGTSSRAHFDENHAAGTLVDAISADEWATLDTAN